MDDDPYTITTELIVRLAGELDITAREQLTGLLREAAAGQADVITVDLAGAVFLDSEAVAALVEGLTAARAAGRGYRLVNATGMVERVLSVGGLLSLAGEDAAR